MTAGLLVKRAGPQMSVQDLGRPGFLSKGLARGGAADRSGHAEGAALLGQNAAFASLEMAGMGGIFEATGPLRIALTGAVMPARIGDRILAWPGRYHLDPGDVLDIGPASSGTYGYLSLGGGIATEAVLGSRSANFVAGIGARVAEGDTLPAGEENGSEFSDATIDVADRFSGGVVRVVPGAQTSFYSEETRARFAETTFVRDRRGNRQGVKLIGDGLPFEAAGQKTVLSEMIVPGDIQMTGDGAPFVLLPECQTTGGYPRIGSVLPEDLPIVAQAAPGTQLRFRFLTFDEAEAAFQPEEARWRALRSAVRPLVRSAEEIRDLLSYQLISGVTAGGADIYGMEEDA
ncbi:5-oxoprolinase subunit C family protein [Ovoidimarina sediminis]|uniref:5-oxoprolinase subunit C family protein n=1 Tax=Ovoidimarina sediminis TaxID=3079856 RepID=UPI00290BEAD9|nr:urea amidolyase [Rhodophyticola sp. MJ-SS7]MDU8945236.1 urea amidolyase [Rhodophyticola sp. MJ-SS7]